jgi:NADH-quinone oxidoreductase subunit N
MNLTAFAVVIARERETPYGDDLRALHGLGADRPWLAWPMTISMLALAGFPATAGFFGKIYLIDAAVDNEYAFLGVAIVLGSAISLAYYLRVVAAVWLAAPDVSRAPKPLVAPGGRPAIAGGSPEADADPDRPAAVAAGSAGAGDREGEGGRPRHSRQLEVGIVAVVCAVLTIAMGIYPDPLFDVARDAGAALADLL